MHRHIDVSGTAWFMGDLHGCLSQLEAALARSNFRPERGDALIAVGDLIDRGPDSLACLALLEQPWFYSVLGNHEAMLLEAMAGDRQAGALWRRNGGEWADQLALGERRHLYQLLPRVRDLPLALTVRLAGGERIGVVHADPITHDWRLLDEAFCERYRRDLLWQRQRITTLLLGGHIDAQIAGIDRVVMGHTPLRGHWLRRGNLCWLDTGAAYHGHLTLLDQHALLAG